MFCKYKHNLKKVDVLSDNAQRQYRYFHLKNEHQIFLQYLKNFPDQFITEMEITRRANGRECFVANSHWAHFALSKLLDFKMVETDGDGKYRLTSNRAGIGGPARKFMAPHIKEILQRSGQKLDLSSYA